MSRRVLWDENIRTIKEEAPSAIANTSGIRAPYRHISNFPRSRKGGKIIIERNDSQGEWDKNIGLN